MSCGCTASFDAQNEEVEFENFDGRGFTDFIDDGEDDNFDNFLTKKMRARNQRKKELMGEGLTKKEAKQKALEEIPRDKLKTIIARMKEGKNPDLSGLTEAQKQALADTKVGEVAQVITGNNITDDDDGVDDDDTTEAGFMGKYGVWMLVGAVVLVGGYFAYKKFGKK